MDAMALTLSSRAADLRRGFDESFAAAAAPPRDDGEGVLAIRAGGRPCAVKLCEISGLHADRRVVALPGRLPSFVGITCLRSGIVAVYSLPVLLGHAPSDAPLRWLLVTGGQRPFALAFEAFDTYARLPRGAAGMGSVPVAGAHRTLLSLSSIAEAVSARP